MSPEAQAFLDDAGSRGRAGTDPLPPDAERVAASPGARAFLDDARSSERTGTDPLPPDAERMGVRPEARAFLDDAGSRGRAGTDPLPPDAECDGALMEVAKLYQVADAESMAAAATYRRLLAAIALSSTALTVAFLLYDEAEAWYLILVVGVMLVVELVATRLATRSRCHERYVEMRVAAECLRVEAFLRYGGCEKGAKELLPWSIRHDLGWIEDVLDSLDPPHAGEPHHAHDCWVEGQRAHHEAAISSATERCADEGALDSQGPTCPGEPHDVRDCAVERQRSQHEGGACEDVLDSLDPPHAGAPHDVRGCWIEKQRSYHEGDIDEATLDSLGPTRAGAPHDVRDCWIDGQRSYHEGGTNEAALDSPGLTRPGASHDVRGCRIEKQRSYHEGDIDEDVLDSPDPPRAGAPHDVRGCWIEGQRAYHEGAISSATERCAASRHVVHASIVLSALLYAFTLGFELCCGGWAMPALMTLAHLERWRAALKICLGSVSAATIFVANYYDKLALDRTLADHQKMATLYELASARIEQEGQTEELLRHLAREELAENATWCAYQQANDPEIVL